MGNSAGGGKQYILSETKVKATKNFEYLVSFEDGRKFKISKDKLGKGSSCEVRLATEMKKKKFYAVKIMERSVLKRYGIDYEKEIMLMKSLDSPYIVKFEGLASFEEKIFFFIEYCDGGNLEEYYKKHKNNLSLKELLKIIKSILSAARELYDKKMIHRDFKPENIFIHKGEIKLGDFGFARFVESTEESLKLTARGTPLYAAPQIVNVDEKFSAKCDVWSLGILFYEILYEGEHPFITDHKCNSLDMYRKILSERAKNFKILKKTPYRPEKLIKMLEQMLAYDEDKRLSIPEVCKIFDEVLRENEDNTVKISIKIPKEHLPKKSVLESVPFYTSQLIVQKTELYLNNLNEQIFEREIPKASQSSGESLAQIGSQIVQPESETFNIFEVKDKIDRNNRIVVFLDKYFERRRDFGHFYLECVYMLMNGVYQGYFQLKGITLTFLCLVLLQKTKRFFTDFLDELLGKKEMKSFRDLLDEKDLCELPRFNETVAFCKAELQTVKEWINLQLDDITKKIEEKKAESRLECLEYRTEEDLDDQFIEKGLSRAVSWFLQDTNIDTDTLDNDGKKYLSCIINSPGLQAKHSFAIYAPEEVNLIPNISILREGFCARDRSEIDKQMKSIIKANK